uniref:Uncharacterized protein n=1 Tax=Cyprinus carpio carpio TaxID=630221 RepID=A0A9J8DBM0_CYPCA
MNSAVYQKILKENVRPSVRDLKLKRTWVLQQDNDPKHTSKSTSGWWFMLDRQIDRLIDRQTDRLIDRQTDI